MFLFLVTNNVAPTIPRIFRTKQEIYILISVKKQQRFRSGNLKFFRRVHQNNSQVWEALLLLFYQIQKSPTLCVFSDSQTQNSLLVYKV